MASNMEFESIIKEIIHNLNSYRATQTIFEIFYGYNASNTLQVIKSEENEVQGVLFENRLALYFF